MTTEAAKVSVTLSRAGPGRAGDRLGTKVGERGQLIGGLVLIAVGIAIASGVLQVVSAG
jgi:putative Mn2+ efflux pump MntP